MITDNILRELLKSLQNGKKAVNMGHSPVLAIEAAFEAETRGLVRNLGDLGYGSQTWWIELTDKGKQFIEIQ